MATYLLSDVHGHRAALEAVLEKVQPSSDDVFYMLGDMTDRGPDPIGSIEVCASLPNVTILLGNHEDMLLNCVAQKGISLEDEFLWMLNGGHTTMKGLHRLSKQQRNELIDWLRALPRYAIVEMPERIYVLVHAGIRPGIGPVPEDGVWDEEALSAMLEAQTDEDLTWIRDEFWGQPTGLVNEQGEGPVVIAGHTPSIYCVTMANGASGGATDEHGLGQMLFIGASEATGGVADKICIDACAAAGHGQGQVGILRLDDFETFYAPIEKGE